MPPASRRPEQLALFGEAKTFNLHRLQIVRSDLEVCVRAPLTLRGYAADWLHFARWCNAAGCDALPTSDDALALYVTWLLTERERKVSTATRHCFAVAHKHRAAGLPLPIIPWGILESMKRRRREKPRGKAAITVDQIVHICDACNQATNAGARDRAMLLVGFASSLRRSDLAALEDTDLRFAREGVAISVRFSKNDQLARGRIVGVWAGSRAETDPIGALKAWLDRRGPWHGPLFTWVTPADRVLERGITGETVHDAMRRAMVRAGIDPRPYGAHSLRAGAITAAAIAGASDLEIMQMSGHKNPAVMRDYIRVARAFQGRNPLAGVL